MCNYFAAQCIETFQLEVRVEPHFLGSPDNDELLGGTMETKKVIRRW